MNALTASTLVLTRGTIEGRATRIFVTLVPTVVLRISNRRKKSSYNLFTTELISINCNGLRFKSTLPDCHTSTKLECICMYFCIRIATRYNYAYSSCHPLLAQSSQGRHTPFLLQALVGTVSCNRHCFRKGSEPLKKNQMHREFSSSMTTFNSQDNLTLNKLLGHNNWDNHCRQNKKTCFYF